MGILKERMEIEQRRGYKHLKTKYVCYNCFNNSSIQEYIKKYAVNMKCDYCGKKYKKNAATNINRVIWKINQSISLYYKDPNDLLFYSDEEGWNSVLDTYEMFVADRAELECQNKKILNDIIKAFAERQWYEEATYYESESKRLLRNWDYFEKIVKEKWRYTYFTIKDPENEIYNIYKIIKKICRTMILSKCIITIKEGTQLYRVRVHDEKDEVNCAKQIGTPKNEYVKKANRLNPINIPMFYGAFTKETAIEESRKNDGKDKITLGVFTNNISIQVIDLSKKIEIPGLYSINNYLIEPIIFINSFAEIICKPINDERDEYLEYIPTQIIVEYIRHVFFKEGKIKGIIYNSSKTNGNNIALFYLNDQCKDKNEVAANEDCLVLQGIERIQ